MQEKVGQNKVEGHHPAHDPYVFPDREARGLLDDVLTRYAIDLPVNELIVESCFKAPLGIVTKVMIKKP